MVLFQSIARITARGHTATLLTDGSVFLVGGINNGVTLASTDSYQPQNLGYPNLGSLTISPQNVPVVQGSTLPLAVTATSTTGTPLGNLPVVIWSSSSPSVVTVSNALGSAGIINALSFGTTTITAAVGDGSNRTGSH